MTQRQYIIFNCSEINLINFSEVLQTSQDTLVKSIDGNKTFVKWESTQQSAEPIIYEYELDEDGMPLPSNQQSQVIEDQTPFIPVCVASLTTKEGPYTSSEMHTILAGSDWYVENNIN